jgi:hypothetical protein
VDATTRIRWIVAAAVVLGTVALAAVLAHITVDVLGDHLLVHDTYDNLAHGSRQKFSLIAGLAALASFVALSFGALRELRGEPNALRGILLGAVPRPTILSVALLTGGALAAMGAMEAFDTRLAGIPIDDPRDLLGGSPLLALSVVALVTPALAFAARALAVALLRSRAIVTIVAAFVRLVPFAAPSAEVRLARAPRRLAGRRSILARRAGKRGPPAFLRPTTIS